jgi:hypothetical protein
MNRIMYIIQHYNIINYIKGNLVFKNTINISFIMVFL